MSAAFLRDVTENIRAAGTEAAIDGHIAYAPAGSEALFDGLLAEGTGLVLADGAIEASADVQGFGRSLLHAARALFDAGYPAACLLNADSPTLPTRFLRDCAEALAEAGDRIVLGAADDGGYYIIGMKFPHPRLFGDIDWSTDRVAAQTRARASELGLPVVELPVWYDVDDHASLRRLIRETAAGHDIGAATPYAAPATAACIARLGLAARVGGPGEG